MGLKNAVKRLERQVSVNEPEDIVTIIDDIPGEDGELEEPITLLHITNRGTIQEEISLKEYFKRGLDASADQ